MTEKIKERKLDHIKVCLEEDVQTRHMTTGFEEVHLVHKALPEIQRNKIDLSTEVFNHRFSAPLIVESMTGGTADATKINAAIARTVEVLGLGMGVGSQRVAIENPSLDRTFKVARKEAPTAFIMANLGGPQLVQGYTATEAQKAVEMLNADALTIHLNPLQEAIQPEGETGYAGILHKIKEIAQVLDVPIIVKETGAGIAAGEARKLESIGVSGIDVAGAGGTSWAAVESHRAERRGNIFKRRLGEAFWDWGIPTAASLVETAQSVKVPVIASGGIRSGIDVAKALTLGASLAGTAHPILLAASKGFGEIEETLRLIIEELKNAMFLVGADSIEKLKRAPAVVTGKTAEWLEMRGFELQVYARRHL